MSGYSPVEFTPSRRREYLSPEVNQPTEPGRRQQVGYIFYIIHRHSPVSKQFGYQDYGLNLIYNK